ncbi:MAG TPA: CehA/McbA family metallohydrolase [Vicinamibacterales bacterium]|nr:CehA/McbA family metallohydrolase [Vicinamibacterales bacterium]
MRSANWVIAFGCLVLAAMRVDAVRSAPVPITLVRHYTPADQVSGRYQYVPFEVAAGTSALRLSYRYDRANGDNVVDLGLFEPGSLELGSPAFRGYSGGSKSAIVVGVGDTTPGYRAGPVPAGTWHVLLGLYKVAPSGLDVTITVEAVAGTAPATQGGSVAAITAIAPSPAARWFKGALHTHTLHSDGTITPTALLEQFRALDFDFVAITDHNNVTHRAELTPIYSQTARPLWIAGEEVTTPGGHANVWGLGPREWIDFRVNAGDPRIRSLVQTAHRYGALFSVNHPVSECVGCGWTHDYVDGIDALEISNGRHGEVVQAVAIWDKLLQAGRRITAVGSSDWHSAPNPLDSANVRVHATRLTEDAILNAIRNGQVIVMRRGEDATPQITVRAAGMVAGVGETLKVIEGAPLTVSVVAPQLANGRLIVVSNGERGAPAALSARGEVTITQSARHGYLRVELLTSNDTPVAYGNPVYLVRP